MQEERKVVLHKHKHIGATWVYKPGTAQEAFCHDHPEGWVVVKEGKVVARGTDLKVLLDLHEEILIWQRTGISGPNWLGAKDRRN